MRSILMALSLSGFTLIFGQTEPKKDSFWTGTSTTSTTSKPAGNHQFFYSQIAGEYGMRPLESIDVNMPADFRSQKSQFDKLVEQGGVALRNEIPKIVRSEVAKIAAKEFGKAAGKELGNVAGDFAGEVINMWADKAAQKKAEEAERQRLLLLEQERQKRLQVKAGLRTQFLAQLQDNNIPIVAPQPENFFVILNLKSDSTLSVSTFNVFANGMGQLPYKVELIKAYQKEVYTKKSWLYGPYKTLKEAQAKVDELALESFTGFFDLEEDAYYVHGGSSVANTPPATSDEDFWGTSSKPKPAETTQSTTDDFWGTKKKDN